MKLLLSKKISRHYKNVKITRKDYNPEEMKWTDSRKQRGAEIMFNAPYEFIELLKQKASYLGLSYSEITKEKQ